jgi:hypothetical protein
MEDSVALSGLYDAAPPVGSNAAGGSARLAPDPLGTQTNDGDLPGYGTTYIYHRRPRCNSDTEAGLAPS